MQSLPLPLPLTPIAGTQSLLYESLKKDTRVHGPKLNVLQMNQAQRIAFAIEYVLARPEIRNLMRGQHASDSQAVARSITQALQAYSREHGVLKVVGGLRALIKSPNRSALLLDDIPVSAVFCRMHDSLQSNGMSAEVSGTSEIKSHELSRVLIAREMKLGRDDAQRPYSTLHIRCELAPNVYASPISALALGVAQEVFLHPQIEKVLSTRKTGSQHPKFTADVTSCLGMPDPENPLESVFNKVQMRVFERLVRAVYLESRGMGTAAKCISQPVVDMMLFWDERLSHDSSMGVALKKYFQHGQQVGNSEVFYADELDRFQAAIRDCRVAHAPPAAIGRAYFNSQFRNLLCEALGLTSPADVAAFELKVRAHRELRTQGVVDAPVNNALLHKVWKLAPEPARVLAQEMMDRADSEPMVFDLDDLK